VTWGKAKRIDPVLVLGDGCGTIKDDSTVDLDGGGE
jgi:hypothetical protein